MKRIFNCFLSAATLCTIVLSWSTANAQDTTDFPIPAEDLMADVLNLNDPVTSIWPSVNDVEIESLSAAVAKLMDVVGCDVNNIAGVERMFGIALHHDPLPF